MYSTVKNGLTVGALALVMLVATSTPAQAQCRGRGSLGMMNPMLQTPLALQAQLSAVQTQQVLALAQLQALQQQAVLQAQLLALQQQPGLQPQLIGQQVFPQGALAQNQLNGAAQGNNQAAQRQPARATPKAAAKTPRPQPNVARNGNN